MDQPSYNQSGKELNYNSALARISPHRELHRVILNMLDILAGPESPFVFVVGDAVVVLEQEIVIRRCSKNTIISRVRTSPYFLDYIFSKLTFKEAKNRMAGNQIKRFSIFEVLFAQKVAHLLLSFDGHHVFAHNFLNPISNISTPDFQLIEQVRKLVQYFDEKTSCLDNVEIVDEHILFGSNCGAFFDEVQKLSGVSHLEVVHELANEICFLFYHASGFTAHFVYALDAIGDDDSFLFESAGVQYVPELFVQEAGHIESIFFKG